MITLNLISPDYKRIIKTKRIFYSLRQLFLYITLFTLILATILLIARKLLDDTLLSELQQTTLVARSLQGNKKIDEINKKIALAQQVQQDYIPWSRLIIDFSKLIPNHTTINSLNIVSGQTEDEWQINISGISATRDDFLSLKKNLLQANDKYQNVDIPIASLFKKEDINFNISFTVTKEFLNNLSFDEVKNNVRDDNNEG
jgi:Tfp pilus assembly protein PilN